MNKLMRKLPLFLAAIMMLVQITGLVAYAEKAANMDKLRASSFATALEAIVFTAAFFMRYETVRRPALGVLALSLAISATLNTFKSITDLPENADGIALASALIFGIMPSLFATVLGMMQSAIAKLPPLTKSNSTDSVPMLVYALVVKSLALIDARLSAAPAPDAGNLRPRCKDCGQVITSGNQGTHSRYHCKKRKVTK